MGTRIRITGAAPLQGAVDLPVDRMIAHRALLLTALSEGDCAIDAQLRGAELESSMRALGSLGVAITSRDGVTGISGRGLHGLRMPAGAIDCARSSAIFSLLSGVLAGQRFGTRLLLASEVRVPSLEHLVGALRARGAHVAATSGTGTGSGPALRPPLSIAPLLPDEQLRGIECELPAPDLYAKSAILMSGLFSAGSTVVSEPILSPDHTERMLSAFGVPVRRMGSMAGFDPAQWEGRLRPLRSMRLPGDATLAAFLAAAASSLPGSRLALRNVGWNPTRTGAFDALRLLGSRLLVVAKGDCAGDEPVAEVQMRAGAVRGGALSGELVSRCGESLPALCLLGARAVRGLQILDGESYARPDDPTWERLAGLMRAFGAEASVVGAGLSITPAAQLLGAQIDVRDDCRLTWPAVLFGLAAEGETLVDNADVWAAEWPDAIECLRELGACIEVQS